MVCGLVLKNENFTLTFGMLLYANRVLFGNLYKMIVKYFKSFMKKITFIEINVYTTQNECVHVTKVSL